MQCKDISTQLNTSSLHTCKHSHMIKYDLTLIYTVQYAVLILVYLYCMTLWFNVGSIDIKLLHSQQNISCNINVKLDLLGLENPLYSAFLSLSHSFSLLKVLKLLFHKTVAVQ